MTREEFEDAKKQSAEIATLLKEGNLTAEDRQKFEMLQTQLAGVLLSTWLPFGWGRRSVMLVLFLVGVYGLVEGGAYFLIAWVLLVMLSPRAVGELAFVFGKFMTGFHGRA